MERERTFLHCAVRTEDGERHIFPEGRNAWALDNLIRAGAEGCTAIDNPGPRWAAYVFKLKTVFGLNIETRHEEHHGPYKGWHGRYILKDDVRIIERGVYRKMEAA